VFEQQGENAGPHSTVIQRAVSAMREHLTERVSVPALATAAGVSVRSLQLTFREQLDLSPLQFLRHLRLQAARSVLLAQALDGITITTIANQFGYANAGRFTAHYRLEYGESPSTTLERLRAAPTRAASHADVVAAEVHRVLLRLRHHTTRPGSTPTHRADT